MPKYRRIIKIINKDLNEDIFEKQKKNIADMCCSILESMGIYKIKLNVVITNDENIYGLIKGNAAFNYKRRHYIVNLTTRLIEEYHKGNKYYLEVSILHELAHLFDYYHAISNKCVKKQLKINSTKRTKDFIFKYGYRFFTEFNAYRICVQMYDKEFECETKYQMLQKYKRIKELDRKIRKQFNKDGTFCEVFDEYVGDIDKFIYSFSKYLAVEIYGKNRKQNYCEKTMDSKEFKEFTKLEIGLARNMEKMCRGTYGKHFMTRINKVGLYIKDNIFTKLGMEFEEKKDKLIIRKAMRYWR